LWTSPTRSRPAKRFMSAYAPEILKKSKQNFRRRNPMPTRLAITVSIAAALLVSGAMPLWAHHAFAAEFDAKQPVKSKGVVTKMEWTNPHVWIHLDVKQPDGSVEKWSVEAGTP